MRDDELALFQRPEQEQAMTMFLARLFCFDPIEPCASCQAHVNGIVTARAYETIGTALRTVGVNFSDRARFFGMLQLAAVTLPPNTKDED